MSTDPVLSWPVYVTDDNRLQCNAVDPCPVGDFLSRVKRRVTLADVVQGVRDHIAAHHPRAEAS